MLVTQLLLVQFALAVAHPIGVAAEHGNRQSPITLWLEQYPQGSPSARWNSAMAYDSNRSVCVLFSGYTQVTGLPGDTWEWDGTAWTLRTVFGAPPRKVHAMAFDSSRAKTVLFGGTNDDGYLGDTWEWDGNSWMDRGTTGPSARYSHAMAYDSNRGKTVLFGGYNPTGLWLSDTWEWDGVSWTNRMVSGPSARNAHAMAYDASRGVTVLFGGVGSAPEPLGDTWEWDGFTWEQRSVSGPTPRVYHAMTVDHNRGITILFGGASDTIGTSLLGDTWEWNGSVWAMIHENGPSPRVSPAMAFAIDRTETVLFGGFGPIPQNDTWLLRTYAPGQIPALGIAGLVILLTGIAVAGVSILRRRGFGRV